MTPSEKALQAAVALWMMAGPLPPRHTSPEREHVFATQLQPMTICLRSGTFKTGIPPEEV